MDRASQPDRPRPNFARRVIRSHSARRYRNAQLALNCREELLVIADYRRSTELALLSDTR